MHAEKCPVCGGSGKIRLPLDPSRTASNPSEVTCHGCGGDGWVEVKDEKELHFTLYPLDNSNASCKFYRWGTYTYIY